MSDGQPEQIRRYRRSTASYVRGSSPSSSGSTTSSTAPYSLETASVRIDVDGTTFELAGPDLPTDGQQTNFCVRPTALTRGVETNRLSVALETCEFRGEHVRAYGRWNGNAVVLQLEAVPEGEAVAVGFESADAHMVTSE
ncbi:TOBE domain-containing protein [Natronorubrum bangense]|uniref:Polyamine-transporting ATPase n=2 Tax=Natronorubrum bangense TaxID=61858 RepID=L9WTV7_9EURY|nr:TOBE domain-containing protein [Natronorubrum bangense]ELY52636.1 polyamine-transporting ATPase [Natronorubrum bangense JCM 10635]QCC55095.1 hypothetical protein DV706_11820 [Natronorubrum bangense]